MMEGFDMSILELNEALLCLSLIAGSALMMFGN